MKDTDLKRFSSVMTALSDYYAKPISEGVIRLYWEGLLQYDIDAVERAFAQHLQNPDSGQWMPKIADVVKMLAGTTIDKAKKAWAKVDRAVRQVGGYQSVVFDDPLIHRVLHDMGGWVPLGMKDEKEWPFVAREFETRYRGYAMTGETPDYPPVLIGMSEAQNSRHGHKIDPPLLIGNEADAKVVMALGTDRPLLGVKVGGSVVALRSGAL